MLLDGLNPSKSIIGIKKWENLSVEHGDHLGSSCFIYNNLSLDPEGLQHFLRVLAHWRQLVDIGTTFKEVEFVRRHH